ncbi:Vacuolar calcium ion transporter [Cytospora mali]|uniref:Vacuolar calcium ion transporter n=1 Tax=Cytospora mali TaxID=578113 RepID=A0A194UZ03_CYTMA|nr:Vacuolar calcium ion transporter [Valsa mali var. pyri (nom. inval.)]
MAKAEKTSSPSETLPHREPVQHKYDDGNGNSTLTPHIKAAGESGRQGFSPMHFLAIAGRSSSKASAAVNVLWPAVPAAIAVRYADKENHLAIFILAYIAMVPCANLIGFAGQEFGRKMPPVVGVLIETTFGSIVEIILFLVLLVKRGQEEVIKAAILGSILANMLLCLGLCFFAAGMRRDESHFSEAVSEAGSGLLLTAGLGLAVPTVFAMAFQNTAGVSASSLTRDILHVSRITAIMLIIAYFVYVWFMGRTHHGIYEAIFEFDEERDHDRHKDSKKAKFTLPECIIALVVSIALVSVIAIALVEEIPFIVEHHGVSDPFMGLILVPLVEKAAEHLTAVDEAWDNQMNFALSHVLGATLQTALFNGPLIVIVGWGMKQPMGLDFDIFNLAMLILAIITVGNFLRDQKSNYLEGFLCVVVYIIIAVAAFYNPTLAEEGSTEGESSTTAERSLYGL